MCVCIHDPRLHDRNGCLVWIYPFKGDRRRNPRRCRCRAAASADRLRIPERAARELPVLARQSFGGKM